MSIKLDKVHYILVGFILILILSNIPTEIEQEIEYTIVEPVNVTKTITVPHVVNETIQLPYEYEVVNYEIQTTNETIFEANDVIVPMGYSAYRTFFLEKGDIISIFFESDDAIQLLIFTDSQFQTWRSTAEDIFAEVRKYSYEVDDVYRYTCQLPNRYYVVFHNYFEDYYVDVTLSYQINKTHSEEITTTSTEVGYVETTQTRIEYNEESFIETTYENKTVTKKITRQISLLFKLLNIY